LATQELDITHEVRNAFQSLDRAYAVAQAAFNRRVAAAERVTAYQAQYELRGTTADPLLRAQQSLVQAEVAYNQALIQYNQAISDYYYRTGTILQESNISIAEDMWDPKAYSDAIREAWARSHGTPNPFVKTEPPEFVVPPGRPTSNLPPVATGIAAPILAPSPAPQNSPSPTPSTTPGPTPQSSPPPPARPPANSAFLSPPVVGAPAGWPQAPMVGVPNALPQPAFLAPPVTAEPAAYFAPDLGTSAFGRAGDVKNRIAAAAAPALFEAPAPAPVETFVAPAVIGAPNAWSMPQVGRVMPRATSSADEVAVPAGDSFEMPENQSAGK
jgi:Outer membrane efflux protein